MLYSKRNINSEISFHFENSRKQEPADDRSGDQQGFCVSTIVVSLTDLWWVSCDLNPSWTNLIVNLTSILYKCRDSQYQNYSSQYFHPELTAFGSLQRTPIAQILFVPFLPAGNILQKHLFLTGSLTLLLIVIKVIQAPSFDSRFSKVDQGDSVTGKVEVTSHSSVTVDECIVRYVEKNRHFLNFRVYWKRKMTIYYSFYYFNL